MYHRDRRVVLPFVATAVLIAAVVHRVLRTGTAAQETVRHCILLLYLSNNGLSYRYNRSEWDTAYTGDGSPVCLALRRGTSLLQVDGVGARPLMEMCFLGGQGSLCASETKKVFSF